MKVLHVIPSVAAVHGGPSVMVELMAKGLTQSGHEIHIATTNDNGAELLDVPCGVPIVRDGLTWWYFKRQTGFYKYSRPLSVWLSAHVADYQVIHIHALFSHAAYAAAYWAHRRGVPYMVRPLGTLNRWGMENRRPWLKNLSFQLIEKKILRNAALVHFTSEQERVEASQLNVAIRSEIIPNPVPDQPPAAPSARSFRVRRPELNGREIILFLSRFDRKKGLELLLPAFAKTRESFPSAALVLAGSGDTSLLKELHDQAAQLGIADHILWPGFLKGEEKRAVLADADIFVLPSWSENFGIAVVEAMAAGCPVIVTDQVAIHGDIAAANAGLVVPCDINALADALRRLLDDRPARASMGLNGKCLTQTHYSLQAVTGRLVSAYNAISH
jgi:glycosyltransferase involved in cell wall biosynthesis